MTRIFLYFDAQIGDITRTAPFQTRLGVGSSQTATMRRQSLWLPRAPGDWRDPLSLGYKFRGSPEQCHLVTRGWTQVGPLCPQEVLKRLRRPQNCSPRRGSRVSPQSPGALGSHKDCLRVVAVWPGPHPVESGRVQSSYSANLCK